MHTYIETLGLSMEIFKYEYNLSRKNIKNNKAIYTLIVERFFNICSRQPDFNTNRSHLILYIHVHTCTCTHTCTMKIGAKEARAALASFNVLCVS